VAPELIRWDGAPAACEVAFSTRHGGVSGGEFASLNLGLLTDDEPADVAENRRLLCAAAGVEPARLAYNWQQHGAVVRRATPSAQPPPADGLVSDEPARPMLVLAADCLPLAVARESGSRPALAVLHAGWRGLLAGIVGAGVGALGRGPLAAVVGPAIGPCCYEVGEEVAAPFAAAFGADVVRRGRLDLWTAAERALRAAGVARVERLDLCTACDSRFFSHRRDAGRTGRQGVLGVVAP
jgi:YfiH family protein